MKITLLILFVIFIYIMSLVSLNPEEFKDSPYLITNTSNLDSEERIPDNVPIKNEVKLLSVSPTEKSSQTFDHFEYIIFTFDGPVDVSKTSLTIAPPVEFYFLEVAEEPEVLRVIPTARLGWRPKVLYTLTLKSPQFRESIVYYYLNNPPDPNSIVFPY